jgi:broad specificity phosphatase PhoE
MPRTIHLIRHGQSTFNAHWESTGIDPLHFDARLSALGEQQVKERRQQFSGQRYDLIVTSPLTRALQTSLGIFGETHPVSAFMIQPLHRERLEQSCDVGRHPSHLASDFGHLTFSHLPDIWWENGGDIDHNGIRVEPHPLFTERVAAFRRWLAARPEASIAVVGHGTFFNALTGKQLANCELLDWMP